MSKKSVTDLTKWKRFFTSKKSLSPTKKNLTNKFSAIKTFLIFIIQKKNKKFLQKYLSQNLNQNEKLKFLWPKATDDYSMKQISFENLKNKPSNTEIFNLADINVGKMSTEEKEKEFSKYITIIHCLELE